MNRYILSSAGKSTPTQREAKSSFHSSYTTTLRIGLTPQRIPTYKRIHIFMHQQSQHNFSAETVVALAVFNVCRCQFVFPFQYVT